MPDRYVWTEGGNPGETGTVILKGFDTEPEALQWAWVEGRKDLTLWSHCTHLHQMVRDMNNTYHYHKSGNPHDPVEGALAYWISFMGVLEDQFGTDEVPNMVGHIRTLEMHLGVKVLKEDS